MGLSGNILVKSHIPKSKFDNVFDIRKSYSQNIHSLRKFIWCFFQYNDCEENISRSISIGPLFSRYDWMGGSDTGIHPIFRLGSNTHVLGVILKVLQITHIA